MARIKLPVSRGFTLADKRNQRLERVTLLIVVAVAMIAAAISFVALKWVGEYINMGGIAFLLPLAIDGFGIICAFGIVRSQSMNEQLRKRASEWVGLAYALGLSVAGNIVHALSAITGAKPPIWLVIGFVSAIPVIVAYGIHLLGRAIDGGVSAHVLADDPDKVQFGLAQIGDENQPAPAPAPRKAAAPAKQAPAKTAPATAPAAPAAAPLAEPSNVRKIHDSAREAVFEEYRSRIIADPKDRMEGGEIAERLGLHPGRGRTLRKEWDTRIAELAVADMPRPELDLPKADAEDKGDIATG